MGGFIANDQFRSTDTSAGGRYNADASRDVEFIDIDTPGGKKVLVHPLFGSVTNDGRIHIKLKRSVGAEVAVARGELDDRPPVREGADEDPLREARAGGGAAVRRVAGRKGELGESSEKARQLSGFLEGMRPESQGRGTPARGFPGMADALR